MPVLPPALLRCAWAHLREQSTLQNEAEVKGGKVALEVIKKLGIQEELVLLQENGKFDNLPLYSTILNYSSIVIKLILFDIFPKL